MLKEKIMEIMELVVDINGAKDRKYHEGIAIFMNVSPHVSDIELSIHLNGWKAYADADESYRIKTDVVDDEANDKKIEEVIDRLYELKEKQEELDAKLSKKEERKKRREAIDVFWDEVDWYDCEAFDRGMEAPEGAQEVADDYSKGFIDKGTMLDNMTKIVKDAMEAGEE